MSTVTGFKSRKSQVFKALVAILGEENVSVNPAVRAGYRGVNYGFMYPWGNGPEIVAMPRSVAHVQEVVKLANKEKFNILPVCAGTITPFWEADMVMDMTGMDKILKIDTENSFVEVEPGVTFNRLDPILAEKGYTVAHGSFPCSFSVLGNLGVRRGFNHNFSGRMADQTLGFELVTPDGALLRTGTATFGYDYWSYLSQDMLDIRGLFAPANQRTPLFGIVTKAAIRIWPLLEARALPIGGFDTFAKAVKFTKAMVKSGIADQSMVWNWVLVALEGLRIKGGKDDIDYLNYRMTHDYTKPYKGLHYCYSWVQIRGYKEQVEANVKVCQRVAKEMGGKILSDSELEDTIPDMSKSWQTCYQQYAHEKTKGAHMWRLGGEGMAEVWYYIGWIDDLIKLEEGYNRRLKEKYNWIVQPYYTRIFDSGIGGHLRYMPCVDMADDFQRDKTMKIRDEMHTWVLDNYPNIHTYGYRMVKTHSIGMGSVLSKIRETLDPNHILYLPGDERLEPEDEAKTAAAASAAS